MRSPDIIFVTIDSLRADHCGFMGYSPDTTPFLSSVSNQGLVFKNFFTNSVQTAFTFPVILAGTPPFAWGRFLGIPPFVKVISQYLKNKFGYRTIAIISSNPALSSSYGYNRGFDEFINYGEYTQIRRDLTPKIFKTLKEKMKRTPLLRRFHLVPKTLPDAEEITQKVLPIIDGFTSEPIFLWIHFMDVHTPYNGYEGFSHLYESKPPHVLYEQMWDYFKNLIKVWMEIKSLPLRERNRHTIRKIAQDILDPNSLTIVKKIYDGAIYGVNKYLQVLYERLSKRSNNAYMVVTSDHGEAFMEHGYPGHEPVGLHNELIKVPLVLLSNREKFGDQIHNPFSQVDLFEIITSLAENKLNFLERSKKYVITEIPMSSISPQFDISNWYTPVPVEKTAYAVITEKYKYIQYGDPQDHELYNLYDDPCEKEDISEENPEIVKHMQETLNTYIDEKANIFSHYRKLMFGHRLRMHLRKRLQLIITNEL